MKLAEALQTRADLNARISGLQRRIYDNALVQEGEQPAEDPKALLAEMDSCAAQMDSLICRINMTNCQTFCEGETLTALLAHRDMLKTRISTYHTLIHESSQTARRATRSEIKILSAVNVAQLQKTVDTLSQELRILENRIQMCNWTTELL